MQKACVLKIKICKKEMREDKDEWKDSLCSWIGKINIV